MKKFMIMIITLFLLVISCDESPVDILLKDHSEFSKERCDLIRRGIISVRYYPDMAETVHSYCGNVKIKRIDHIDKFESVIIFEAEKEDDNESK